MQISILKVHVTKPSIFLNPIANLLETLHPKFIFLDGSVEFFKIQNRPKFPRTTRFSNRKVGRDKLSCDRIDRCYSFFNKKISSLLYKNIMSRTRNVWIFRQGVLNWDISKWNFVPRRNNIQNPTIATHFLPILNTKPEPTA